MDSLNLDRQSVVPLYFQIQQQLLQHIRLGRFKPGRPLPSEEVISKRLRVSRMTARQALKSLCSQGVAYSQRGKGTFVAETKLEKNFRQVLSFSEEMEARGTRPHSKVTSFRGSLRWRSGGRSSPRLPRRKVDPVAPRSNGGFPAHGRGMHMSASPPVSGFARKI